MTFQCQKCSPSRRESLRTVQKYSGPELVLAKDRTWDTPAMGLWQNASAVVDGVGIEVFGRFGQRQPARAALQDLQGSLLAFPRNDPGMFHRSTTGRAKPVEIFHVSLTRRPDNCSVPDTISSDP